MVIPSKHIYDLSTLHLQENLVYLMKYLLRTTIWSVFNPLYMNVTVVPTDKLFPLPGRYSIGFPDSFIFLVSAWMLSSWETFSRSPILLCHSILFSAFILWLQFIDIHMVIYGLTFKFCEGRKLASLFQHFCACFQHSGPKGSLQLTVAIK